MAAGPHFRPHMLQLFGSFCRSLHTPEQQYCEPVQPGPPPQVHITPVQMLPLVQVPQPVMTQLPDWHT